MCQPFAPRPLVLEWDHTGLLILSFAAFGCFKTRRRHSSVLCLKRPEICLALMLLSFVFCPFLTVDHSESLAKVLSMKVLVGTTRRSTASKNLSASGSKISCSGTVSRSCLAKASSWQSLQLKSVRAQASLSSSVASASIRGGARAQGYR